MSNYGPICVTLFGQTTPTEFYFGCLAFLFVFLLGFLHQNPSIGILEERNREDPSPFLFYREPPFLLGNRRNPHG